MSDFNFMAQQGTDIDGAANHAKIDLRKGPPLAEFCICNHAGAYIIKFLSFLPLACYSEKAFNIGWPQYNKSVNLFFHISAILSGNGERMEGFNLKWGGVWKMLETGWWHRQIKSR